MANQIEPVRRLASNPFLQPPDQAFLPGSSDDVVIVRPDPVRDPFPLPPLPGEPIEPEPGTFSGGFDGRATLVVEDPNSLPGPGTTLPEVGTRNLKRDVASGWTEIRPFVAQMIARSIEGFTRAELPRHVTRLYDPFVELRDSNRATDPMNLNVYPGHRSFWLFYVTTRHTMEFKADVTFGSHVRFTVDFDLGIDLGYATGGRPATTGGRPLHVNGSVWLATAGLRFMGVRASAHPNDAVLSVANAFRSFKTVIEQLIAGYTENITFAGGFFTSGLRTMLAAAQSRGHSTHDVLPWYDADRHRLLLRLRQQPPVLDR